MSEVVTSRPVKLAKVSWALAVFVGVVFALIGAGLRGSGETAFRLADQIAMTGLGVCIAGAALLLTRPRIVADADGVRVRNVLGYRHFPWQVVAAVRMDEGSSWASLDLQDDDTVGLLAVQTNDGARAVEVVLELRRLLAASRA